MIPSYLQQMHNVLSRSKNIKIVDTGNLEQPSITYETNIYTNVQLYKELNKAKEENKNGVINKFIFKQLKKEGSRITYTLGIDEDEKQKNGNLLNLGIFKKIEERKKLKGFDDVAKCFSMAIDKMEEEEKKFNDNPENLNKVIKERLDEISESFYDSENFSHTWRGSVNMPEKWVKKWGYHLRCEDLLDMCENYRDKIDEKLLFGDVCRFYEKILNYEFIPGYPQSSVMKEHRERLDSLKKGVAQEIIKKYEENHDTDKSPGPVQRAIEDLQQDPPKIENALKELDVRLGRKFVARFDRKSNPFSASHNHEHFIDFMNDAKEIHEFGQIFAKSLGDIGYDTGRLYEIKDRTLGERMYHEGTKGDVETLYMANVAYTEYINNSSQEKQENGQIKIPESARLILMDFNKPPLLRIADAIAKNTDIGKYMDGYINAPGLPPGLVPRIRNEINSINEIPLDDDKTRLKKALELSTTENNREANGELMHIYLGYVEENPQKLRENTTIKEKQNNNQSRLSLLSIANEILKNSNIGQAYLKEISILSADTKRIFKNAIEEINKYPLNEMTRRIETAKKIVKHNNVLEKISEKIEKVTKDKEKSEKIQNNHRNNEQNLTR